jgi:primary-amine oxidase
MSSPLFQAALAEFKLPEGFEVVIEPWPYGGLDHTDENRRYFQGLCFARDTLSGNPDTNFYSYPLPVIPVMDAHTQEIIRVDRPATGGNGDGLTEQTFKTDIIGHCKPSEYIPELLPEGTRKDLKPLNVVQPEGPSFRVTDDSLVEWQKWRFRVAFNPREGATIHDVWYDGRSVMHRLAVSEMVCVSSFIGLVSCASETDFRSFLCSNRLSLMPILDRHSTVSRLLILVMVVVETWPTIFPSDVIALV